MQANIDFTAIGIDTDTLRHRSSSAVSAYTCLVEYERNASFEGNVVEAVVLTVNDEVVLTHKSTFETGDYRKEIDISAFVKPGQLNVVAFKTHIYDMTMIGVEVTTSSTFKLKFGRTVLASANYRTQRPAIYRAAADAWHVVA